MEKKSSKKTIQNSWSIFLNLAKAMTPKKSSYNARKTSLRWISILKKSMPLTVNTLTKQVITNTQLGLKKNSRNY